MTNAHHETCHRAFQVMLKRAADDAVVLHGYGDVTDDDCAQVAQMIAAKGGPKGRPRVNHAGELDEFDVMDVLETADNAGLKPKYRNTGTLKVNQNAFRNVIRASNALHQAQWDLEELQERGGDSSGAGFLAGLFGGAFSGAGAAGLLAKALGGSKDAVDWSVIGGFAGGGIGGMLLGEMAESWQSIRAAERRRDEARARLGKALDDYVARHGPPEF